MWDFSWITELSAWAGLGTLVLLEVVLGVDNLVFISILVGRLPAEQKRHAFLTGLGLALLMRLVLLAAIAWIIGLTAPLFTLGGRAFSARDLILIGGGLFLLLKGTLELHERLEGQVSGPADAGRHAGFWRVIAQIIALDAVFSLDSIITSVGMVDHVSVMMLAVVAAMLVMALAAAPLLRFVERHPSVIVLCLGFLLMIGLGLAMSLIMFVGARASMVLMLGEASPAAMDEGMAYLRWISVFYVLCFIGSAYVGLYRGMGWVSVPVIGSVLQQTIRVILAYTLAGPMGLAGVALAIGTGWSAIVLYQTILFRTKVRLRKNVE